MNYSGVQIASWLVLLLGTAAVVVALATNYWLVFNESFGIGTVQHHQGLVYSCTGGSLGTLSGETCSNRYKQLWEDVKQAAETADTKKAETLMKNSDVTTWEFSVLVLMFASGCWGVLALLTGFCCCHRCGGCQATVTLMAFLCSAAAIGVYAYMNERDLNAEVLGVNINFNSLDARNLRFYSWSYWVAVGGSAGQLFAAIMFCIGRGRAHAYTQQI